VRWHLHCEGKPTRDEKVTVGASLGLGIDQPINIEADLVAEGRFQLGLDGGFVLAGLSG
jgi:hypothetical protein